MQASGCQRLPEPLISRLMAMLQSTRQHGARLRPPGLRSSGPGFNPRARKGRDAGCAMDEALSDVFQSTRPHGARPWSVPAADAPVCFNPRARTGRDWAYPRPISAASSFNPRARTGRDSSSSWCAAAWGCFNPRARTGRDQQPFSSQTYQTLVSIHAPARGATGYL